MDRETEGVYSDYQIGVPPEFEAVFSHFYFAVNRSGSTVVKKLMPSYQTIMVFSFGVPVRFTTKQGNSAEVDKCLLLGPLKHAFDYALPSGAEILVVNFRDDAFFRFFGDAALPGNRPFHPDRLVSDNCFTAVWEDLNQIDGADKRVDYLLSFCEPYLGGRDRIATELAGFDKNGLSPVKEVSERNNLSERAVQMSHKKHFGYSAKEIGRYRRFMKAIRLIQGIASGSAAKVNWFEIIESCGYYDQSQLIHDFNYYIGLSPAKYLKFQKNICGP